MAPVDASEGVPDDGKKATTTNDSSEMSSTRMPPSGPRKRATKEPSQVRSKRQKKPPVGKNAASRLQMGQRKQKRVSQKYQNEMTTRNIIGQIGTDGDAPGRPSTDTEDSSNMQGFLGSRPGVEDDVLKAEQKTIDNALERCRDWVDPGSPRNRPFILRDIKTHRTPIQFATLGWMFEREASKGPVGGGIVGHDMGTGKSLMAIALMVTNKTSLEKKTASNGGTLVIVPNKAVIDHCRKSAKVMRRLSFRPIPWLGTAT